MKETKRLRDAINKLLDECNTTPFTGERMELIDTARKLYGTLVGHFLIIGIVVLQAIFLILYFIKNFVI